MSEISIKQLLKYINEARTNPKGFVKYVQEDIKSFTSDTQMPLKPGLNYQVNESKACWFECKKFLEGQSSIEPLSLSKSLNLTAQDHCNDLANNDMFGHTGSDGSSLSERIKRRCGTTGYGSWAENIGSDFAIQNRNHALKTVLGLIVDDGVKSRGHRTNIFNPDYKFIGLFSRKNQNKMITVMNFHQVDLPVTSNHKVAEQPKGTNHFNPQVKVKSDEGKKEKKMVSSETKQETSVCNGKKTVKTTVLKKYSDGSTSQETTIKTTG